MANPAYLRGNARAIYSPMSIIDISAHGGLDYHFGSVATVMGFPSADAEYGDDAAMNALWEEGNHSSATGWHAGASVTLKAKAGPLIVMLNGDMTHWNVNAEDNVEGDWYFEREQELMLALGGGQVLSLNGIFLYEIDRDLSDGASLRVGNLTTRRTSIAAEDELLRTGLLAIWTRNEHFSHILTVQPYLRDRAFTSAMPPFVGYIVKYQR